MKLGLLCGAYLLLWVGVGHALETASLQPTRNAAGEGRSATIVSSAATEDATPDSPAARFVIEEPGTYRVDCDFLGQGKQSNALMFLERRALAVKSAGALTLVGTQAVGADLGSGSWKATLAVNGQAIEARVTGGAATRLIWTVRCSVDAW